MRLASAQLPDSRVFKPLQILPQIAAEQLHLFRGDISSAEMLRALRKRSIN